MSSDSRDGFDLVTQSLGCIAIFFSFLELHVDTVIGHLLGLQIRQRLAVTSSLSSIKREELLKCATDAYWTKNKDLKAEFEDIATKFGEARIKRNKYVHGFWSFEKEPFAKHQVINFKVRTEINIKDDKATPLELMDFVMSLIEFQKRIKKLFDETEGLPKWNDIYVSPGATATAESILKKVLERAQQGNQNQDEKQ